MATKYSIAQSVPALQKKSCTACAKRLGKGSAVQLDDQYFHPDCFFDSDGYGATTRQIRHLKALFSVMQALPLR